MVMDLYQAVERDAPRVLTPEMAEEYPDLVADLKRHPSLQARWATVIVRKAQVQAIYAASEQLAIWRANAERPRGFVEGLGEQVAAIAPGHFNFLCWKYGPDWFRDAECLEDTLQRHPEMRVESRGKIRVNGFRFEQEQEADAARGADGLNGAGELTAPAGLRRSGGDVPGVSGFAHENGAGPRPAPRAGLQTSGGAA